MASRGGNFGGRNKSNRGPSHFRGKNVHRSSGDLSYQGSSDVSNEQNRGGRGHRGRGRGQFHGEDHHDNRIPETASAQGFRGQYTKTVVITQSYQSHFAAVDHVSNQGHPNASNLQKQGSPNRGQIHRGRGGFNQTGGHHVNRNSGSANARDLRGHHPHLGDRQSASRDQYQEKNYFSMGNVRRPVADSGRKFNFAHSARRNVSPRTGGISPHHYAAASPNIQWKGSAAHPAGMTHFRGNTMNLGITRNVPIRNINQHLKSPNSGLLPLPQNKPQSAVPVMFDTENVNTSSNSAPRTIIKHKSKKFPNRKKAQSVDSVSKVSKPGTNEDTKPNSQGQSKKKKQRKSRKLFELNRVQQASEPSLLNFSRATPPRADYGAICNEDSDQSDTVSTISYCSSNDSNPSALHEDLCVMESDSSSEESEDISISSREAIGKPESQNSDALKQIYPIPKLPGSQAEKSVANFPNAESYVAVYWDIENCPVPPQKSAIDIVKKVRDTFYENRTEADFIVVCDTRNLNQNVSKELNEALVTIVYTDSSNKEAADRKLQFFIQRFQYQYEKTNSAIVLISGDSDFSSYLYAMRYRHGIYVSLICKNSTRTALQAAAHKCIFYEDFIKDLPDRRKEDNVEFCMMVSGFPANVSKKMIKNALTLKIKGVNGRVRKVSGTAAEIVFSNESGTDRAQNLLEGAIICGSSITLTRYKRSYENSKSESSEKASLKETAGQSEKSSVTGSTSGIGSTQDMPSDSGNQDTSAKRKKKNKNKENVSETFPDAKNNSLSKSECTNSKDGISKNAALKVSVQYKIDDEEFWRNEFMHMLKTSDITVQKGDSYFDGFFLIYFSSIGKAQKAQKKIQQDTSPLAPKFIKLIKDDIILSPSTESSERSRVSTVVEKIEEIKRTIEVRRKHCLQELEGKLNDLKKQCCDASNDESEAVKYKISELNDQKAVFLRFNNNFLQKLTNLCQKMESNVEQVLDDYLKDYSRECSSFSEGLPIYARKDDIVRAVKKNQVVLIRAETGSGKSTQIIQYLWRNGFGQKKLIVCTQPRKLAAISIAKHVGNQIGSSVGGIVGYQVGLSNKKSDKTEILFLTDLTLLRLCVNDQLFQDISCVIIDEAHERSIYTDLLLGMIKSALPRRKDLKIIITSATIDTSVFCTYFGLQVDAVLQVSGRTFPIDDVWLEKGMSVGWKYMEKAINVALDLLEEAPGDILVFLTTPLETEQASTLMKEKLGSSNKKVIVHHLHGKLDVSEQQKVFVAVPKGSRKVVFATNCAETSITIPGIRYVIDSGMVKESKYDAARNLNVLSVGFVSRSSAEQRRGRAGRTQSGKCFRLYSKSNYENDMAPNTEPEILRVNLGQALLKLMELGVQDPTQFDFVQSPSQESLVSSMKQLIHLGAVDQKEGMMLEIGKKMAKLPVEPRLSHLIFQGIEQNIGYESVVIAALATVSRNIFFRNEENKKEADAKKVRFCQSESDFFTYFEIFKEWITTPKADRAKWCVSNCINAKSMRVALELVTELLETIRRELNIQVNSRFTENQDFVEVIHNIIFYSYAENLCVFSGYYKFGYRSPNLPGEFHVHPSSSLCYLGQWKPTYIVYDTILKTSQAYLINTTPVSEEAVQYAVQCGWLPYDLDTLESLALSPYHIVPVGETILKKHIFGKRGCKRLALEKRLQDSIGDNPCALEVKFGRGEIIVYLASCYHQYVEEIIFPVIVEAQQELHDEQDILNISDLPKLDLVLGAGAEVREVILPGEFRTVEVKLNGGTPLSAVVEELCKFGEIHLVKEYPTNAKVTFSHVASAVNAVENFKNEEKKNFVLRPQLRNSEMRKDEKFFKVFISILRRPCTGLAFISFKSLGDLPVASNALCGKTLFYDSTNVVEIAVSRTQQELMVKKLPGNATKEKLLNLLKRHLPDYVEINQVKILRNKEFESTRTDVADIKQQLVRLFSDYTPTNKVDIELRNVKSKDFTWNAWAYFYNSQDGQIAVNAINGRSIVIKGQHQILEMKPLLKNTLFCDSNIFVAVKDQIEEALAFYKSGRTEGDQLNICAKDAEKNSGVVITITSNNLCDITDARNCIMKILMGDKICCSGNPHLEKLFLQHGRSFLKHLESEIRNICLKLNATNKVITIFGSEASCTAAKTEINKYLDSISLENSIDIHLISNDFPKGLLRELVKRHGYNLDGLRTLCNLQSIEVNANRHILTVTGDASAIDKTKDILKEISVALCQNFTIEGDEDIETCPICLMPVDEKFHRLEYCGHACCHECILLLFRNQDTPLECPKEECKMPIVMQDIHWVFKQDKEIASALCCKALECFVQRNKGSINYCPTPDCSMVYRACQGEDFKFCCPSCQNDICTKCHAVYHYGMTCELYKCSQKDEDYSLKVWLQVNPNNRKQCPSCKSPIEKNGGCNHMTCWKCKCHMCWLCEKVFPRDKEVYIHQAVCPRKPV